MTNTAQPIAIRGELYRLLINSIKDYAIFMLDSNGRVASWNPGAERTKGYREGEILGRSMECFYTSEDKLQGKPAALLRQAAEEGRVEDEGWRVRKDGTRFWADVVITAIRDEAGQLEGFSKVTRDLTHRKSAETERERYARFFSLSLDLFCIAGVDGYFKDLSPTWVNVLGYTKEELMSKPYMEFVLPEDRAVTIREAGRLAQGASTFSFENRYRCKDGSIRCFQWNASFVAQQQQVYAIARDITARREAEEKVLQLNKELEERVKQFKLLNTELEAFSYSVSHDLRAPLRHIAGFSELLESDTESTLSESGRKFLKTIVASVRQMGRLIDDLLSFSRMGRVEMQKRPIDLAPLVRDIQQELSTEAEGRHIAWKILPLPSVRGDLSMMRQVFRNLLSNALKYTRPRETAIIEIGMNSPQDGQSVFYVRDNGVGFDMKYVEKLFGVFQRLHSASEFEGTGIGLANVRRIIHRHGGRTWAESALDQGATIFFSLPQN